MSKEAYAADEEIQSLLERGMDKTLHWFPSDFNVVRLATVLVGMAPVRYLGVLLFFQAAAATGIFPLTLVAVARRFNREQRSMATSLIMMSSIIFGGGAAPYLLGLSGDLIGFRFGIVALGALVILLSPLILIMKNSNR